MAKTPKADHTACPHCGHSPIAESDERCPKCYNWLRELPTGHAAKAAIHNDAEQDLGDAIQGTRIGGLDLITGDAEAHPGHSALLLVCLGLFLGAAGMRLLPASGNSNSYLLLAAGNVLAGIFLYSYPTFARPLLMLSAPAQAGFLLYLGQADLHSPQTLALAAAPLALIPGLAGEPGPTLRGFSFSVGLGLLLYSGTVRLGSRYLGAVGPLIDAPQAGFRLQLPVGFALLESPEALAPYLITPGLDPQMVLFAFHDPVLQAGGLWGLAPAGRYQMGRLAEGFAGGIDGPAAGPKPVAVELSSLRLPQVTFERGLGPGRSASVTALRLPDDRVAVLVVAGAPHELEALRQGLSRGATFAPARAP